MVKPSSLAVSLLLLAASARAEEPVAPLEVEGEGAEVITIEDRTPPGSAQTVAKEQLERFAHDDVHKVLSSVPGVYIREEDGYGLRPNIGMRGAASERSAKIALLEDGVLIAPAPYSGPAAYYFPTMARIVSVTATKGPGSISYGPNTVGGAVDLGTRPIPERRELFLDAAGGSDVYGKLHAGYGETWSRFGFLLEGVKLHSDGFKKLDGGGDTGFDKHDVVLKSRLRLGNVEGGLHDLTVKLGYADEVSNETYTGLSDADFEASPYRRYRGTHLDRMDWRHWQASVGHKAYLPGLTLTTTLYRHTFTRDWRKLNEFANDVAIADVLANPTAGNNAVYYSILTGAASSTSDAESLVVGTNERDFVSQGVQVVGTGTQTLAGLENVMELGARLHADHADRFHHEETYGMQGGDLVRDGVPRTVSRDARGSAVAVAAYYKHKVTISRFTVTAGMRTEHIRTKYEDRAQPMNDDRGSQTVLLPGGGVVYQPWETLGFLAGVHKGFVPVAPGEADDAHPEKSWNYEAGLRWSPRWGNAEVIGFFSDYSNLKGTCSFSSGCDTMAVDTEFDGGAVHIHGVEAVANAEPRLGPLRFPLALTYTLTRTAFQTSFNSSNPEWGSVEEGDELPYLPEHQLAVQAAVAGKAWEVAVAGRYTSAMRDVAGSGEVAEEDRTDDAYVIDAAVHYDFGAWGEAYVTVDNVLDQAFIVSRRPFGARPGVPRLVVLGYRWSY